MHIANHVPIRMNESTLFEDTSEVKTNGNGYHCEISALLCFKYARGNDTDTRAVNPRTYAVISREFVKTSARSLRTHDRPRR